MLTLKYGLNFACLVLLLSGYEKSPEFYRA